MLFEWEQTIIKKITPSSFNIFKINYEIIQACLFSVESKLKQCHCIRYKIQFISVSRQCNIWTNNWWNTEI